MIGITRCRNWKIPSLVGAGGRGTRNRSVRGGPGRVECRRWRRRRILWSVAVEPWEFTAGVDDHCNILRRRSDRQRDSEADVMPERKLVRRSPDGFRRNNLGFEGKKKGWVLWGTEYEILKDRKQSTEEEREQRFEKFVVWGIESYTIIPHFPFLSWNIGIEKQLGAVGSCTEWRNPSNFVGFLLFARTECSQIFATVR